MGVGSFVLKVSLKIFLVLPFCILSYAESGRGHLFVNIELSTSDI